ncbi:MAG TPA: HEAT repeat domain-containing protein [Longimicrobium sp.]|nr:HEAT repeat domain-containing protein [Longimicrobium sp.]
MIRRIALAALGVFVAAALGFALGRRTDGVAAPSSAGPAPESLYVAGRRALSDGRHAEAAVLFRWLGAGPVSPRAADAPYWEALARYRAGTPGELRVALQVLDAQARRHPQAPTRPDAQALAARIRAVLTRVQGSAASVADTVPNADAFCRGADPEAETTALSSLLDDDPARAVPVLAALARRTECPPEVRRRAVMLLAQRPTPEGAEVVVRAARGDPSPEVRAEAAMWLGAFPAARVLPVLDSIARHAPEDERTNALAGMAQLHTPDARAAIERLLRDPSASADAKEEALQAVMGFDPGPEEGALLRGLYPSLEAGLRPLAIQALGHVQDAQNAEWLLRMGLDPATPSDLAGEAVFWSARAGIPRERLIALYPALKDPARRERLLHALSEADPPALDLLRHAAQHDPDPELRLIAREWLRERVEPHP